ncbi:MAG: hypothetical protein BGO69_15855 [Bacteroidetes bacterium 46-16]|nr:MAG: hypothetical protein BGO69_15855 [Bacteroidetes bacterium 46-16]
MAENITQCSRYSQHSIYNGASTFTIPSTDIIKDLEVTDLVVNEFGFNEGEKAIYARIGDNDIREVQTTITSKISVGTGSGTYSIMSFDLDALGINSISFAINAIACTTDNYHLNSVLNPYVILASTYSSGMATHSFAGIITPTGQVDRKFPVSGNNLSMNVSATGSVFTVSIVTDNKAGNWQIKTTMNTLFNDVNSYNSFNADTGKFTSTDGTITYGG